MNRALGAARQSRNESCRRPGCRLQVESCRLASNALGQLATCNLQLATSSQPANNLDYCSAGFPDRGGKNPFRSSTDAASVVKGVADFCHWRMMETY
jgi:hypothetical protein